MKEVISLTVVTSLVFLGLVLAMAWIVSGAFTKPFRRLAQGYERLAKGESDFRIEESYSGEVGALVEGFNRMAGELSHKQEQIREIERLSAWKRMSRVLSHEVRNSLTPIKLTFQRLAEDRGKSGLANRVEAASEVVLSEIANLERLTASFRSLAKMPDPKLERIDARKVAQSAYNLWAAERKELQLALPPEPVEILCDPGMVREALSNLLKNGFEASAEGTPDVALSLESDSRYVRFVVSDRGRGITEGDTAALFDPFYTTKSGGSGVGLFIVETVAVSHGGKVELLPNKPKGTRAIIYIPLAHSPVEETEVTSL